MSRNEASDEIGLLSTDCNHQHMCDEEYLGPSSSRRAQQEFQDLERGPTTVEEQTEACGGLGACKFFLRVCNLLVPPCLNEYKRMKWFYSISVVTAFMILLLFITLIYGTNKGDVHFPFFP